MGKFKKILLIILCSLGILFLIGIFIGVLDNTQPETQGQPINLPDFALSTHELINNIRQANGLDTLAWNPKIAQSALNHSMDMATRNYFSHTDLEGHDLSYRYDQVNFNCKIESYSQPHNGGENILFMGGVYSENTFANKTVSSWMNSTDHRDNILNPIYRWEGIGIAESNNGVIYVTEDFC